MGEEGRKSLLRGSPVLDEEIQEIPKSVFLLSTRTKTAGKQDKDEDEEEPKLDKKLSQPARNLVENGLDKKTRQRYHSESEKYKKWCRENGLDATQANALQVTNYLAQEATEKDLGAKALGTRRAAISDMLQTETGVGLPESRTLTLAMRGAAKRKPSVQVNPEVWDLSQLTTHIVKNWPDNEELTNDDLVTKVAILMTGSGLRQCDVRNIHFLKSNFNLGNHCMNAVSLTKEGMGTRYVNCLITGSKDASICPHCATQEYLRRRPRTIDPDSTLLVFVAGPNKGSAIHPDTLSNMIQKTMSEAEIPDRFSPRSLRAASASAAIALGVTLDAVRLQFRWAPTSKVPVKSYIRLKRKLRKIVKKRTGAFNAYVLDLDSLERDEDGHFIMDEEPDERDMEDQDE